MKDIGKNIRVSTELWKKITALKHPGQSRGGFIKEMLEKLGYK